MSCKDPIRAGLDEVGWGALAGPIISVVAAFRQDNLRALPPGVKDSKKTSEERRSALYERIIRASCGLGVGYAWPWEIDEMGPYAALQMSYRRALEDMPLVCPDLLIVDGDKPVEWWKGKQSVEPKADVKFREVSAASMVAKHFRDTLMKDYARAMRPFGLDYGWERNMGYGTSDHEAAIRRHGLLIDPGNRLRYMHRRRYCKKFLYEAKRGGNAMRGSPLPPL